MIDNYGRWTPEEDYSTYPREKWCDMDRVAAWIQQQEYTPQTSLENLTMICILHYEGETEENETFGSMYNKYGNIDVSNLADFVYASGGLREFDYEC